MRRTGKWLAVLLSVTMLAGTAPVYGADISVESDFSSEISGEDSLSDDLGESEITEEPADENTEITEEADTDEDETEISVEDFADDQEEWSTEDTDENTAEVFFEDQQEVGAGETKEYLKDLSVYSGYGVKDPLEMTRREDLDETYGGKTYTVEIGSSYIYNCLLSTDKGNYDPCFASFLRCDFSTGCYGCNLFIGCRPGLYPVSCCQTTYLYFSRRLFFL